MATIDVSRSHELPKEEAKKRAETLAQSMKQKLDLDWRWDGDRIVFDASRGPAKGTKGSVEVGDREVRVLIDLPFLLRMMKGTVESRVREKLAQVL
jgi:putative polyhydroxyalkanoate system protein